MRAKAKSDVFTAASSCCRQNLKFENFSHRLAAYVKDIFLNACCTCSTIIFPIISNKSLICDVADAVIGSENLSTQPQVICNLPS